MRAPKDDPWPEEVYGATTPVSGSPSTPRLDEYNKTRRTRGYRPLTLEEYQKRCDYMAIYRDTIDPDERDAIITLLKAQDEPPKNKYAQDEGPEIPMPDYIRKQIEEIFGPSRDYDVPKREF